MGNHTNTGERKLNLGLHRIFSTVSFILGYPAPNRNIFVYPVQTYKKDLANLVWYGVLSGRFGMVYCPEGLVWCTVRKGPLIKKMRCNLSNINKNAFTTEKETSYHGFLMR